MTIKEIAYKISSIALNKKGQFQNYKKSDRVVVAVVTQVIAGDSVVWQSH